MVASLSLVTFALSALSLVSARAVPRQTKPDGYVEGYLEEYSTYKTRFLALECYKKHNTDYFDLCCHPMLATENLEDKDPSCNPANVSASSSVTEPTSTDSATEPTQAASFTGDGDDDEDCDDEEDDGDYEDCDDETGDSQSQAPSSAQAPPPPTTTAEQAPPESTSAEQAPPTTTDEQAPPTSTTEEQAPPTSTSTTEEQAPTSTSTTEDQAPTTTTQDQAPTTTDAAPTTTSEESQPTQGSDNGNNGNGNSGGNQGGDAQTGGIATWFTQNGVAGACGAVHGDNDFIAAIDQDRYGDLSAVSSLCGKQVEITNNNNGKTITVTIVDACPTCQNGNSIDLSTGAFQALGDLGEGVLPITWHFV